MIKPDERLQIHYVHSRSIGSHSINDASYITEACDAVICFSDNQIGFPHLKKRCRRLRVPCLPYVGVLGSNSPSRFKRLAGKLLTSNVRYYKGMTVLAKTPQIKQCLEFAGQINTVLAPVGLDGSLLHPDYRKTDKTALRSARSLPKDGKVLLFLARMTEEKRPLAMAEIFHKLHQMDESYHLVVIGKGGLAQNFAKEISQRGLEQSVTWLEQVPNAEIWQYFCAADVFVNLNVQEIFGMAILEAMYYECAVVARSAPGPEYILSDAQDGVLCADDTAVCNAVNRLFSDEGARSTLARRAHEKIVDRFLWDYTAELIMKEIQGV